MGHAPFILSIATYRSHARRLFVLDALVSANGCFSKQPGGDGDSDGDSDGDDGVGDSDGNGDGDGDGGHGNGQGPSASPFSL